ncbi:MAG TPA: response regulator [Thermoanaerobaculia bacterium]
MLIADSDPHLRQLLYSALLAGDVFSDCVSTVPDALDKLREEPYGVILVDVGLPGGDPEQIVAAIAALGGQRPVVIVLASNPASARSLDIDVVQIVLRKPLALRQTVELIRSCVQNAAVKAAEDGDGDQPTA